MVSWYFGPPRMQVRNLGINSDNVFLSKPLNPVNEEILLIFLKYVSCPSSFLHPTATISAHSPHHLILTVILSSPSVYRTSFLLHLTLMTTVWLTSHLRLLYEDVQWPFIPPDQIQPFFTWYSTPSKTWPSSYLADFLMLLSAPSPLLWSSQCPWESHIHHYLEVTCSFLLANSFFSIWLNLACSSWPTSSIKSHVSPSLIAPAHTDLLCLSDSCWCTAKPIQYCKVISFQLK